MDSQLSVDSFSSKPALSDSTLVPPQTYLYARDGPSARIWALSEEEARNRSRKTINELGNSLSTAATVIAESTPNPFKPKSRDNADFQRIETGSNLGPRLESGERGPADFYVQFSKEGPKDNYILWEGAGPQSEAFPNSKRLMDIKPESVLGNTSTYIDAEEPEGRAARMDKADSSWFSVNRTMEDFDGMQYTWKTDLMDNLKCIRSDGTEMAYFHRTKFAWIEIGLLDVKKPTTKPLLHLLLSAALMKYQQYRKRRGSESPQER
ncbi:hypothetical protein FRC04_002815 [Tulasnella sp. 424]|nr:hypothetical protein FRC04_002815 [Tulasnella sp. 424]